MLDQLQTGQGQFAAKLMFAHMGYGELHRRTNAWWAATAQSGRRKDVKVQHTKLSLPSDRKQ